MGARREVLTAVAYRYRAAGRREKGRILDELTATTGWHRKQAVRALSQRVATPARSGSMDAAAASAVGDDEGVGVAHPADQRVDLWVQDPGLEHGASPLYAAPAVARRARVAVLLSELCAKKPRTLIIELPALLSLAKSGLKPRASGAPA